MVLNFANRSENFQWQHLDFSQSDECFVWQNITLVSKKTKNNIELKTRCRSSRSQMFFIIGVLKNFANFTGQAPVSESLFNEVAGMKAYNFIEKRF